MKTYEVEMVKINKEYVRVTVEAHTKKEALRIARTLNSEDLKSMRRVRKLSGL